MKVEQFTLDPEIVHIINDLKEHFNHDNKLIISDIVDDNGNQYVDLVQEGGGVLGIALLGYTYILEQMGIRFLNIGGTFAGAINSLALAAIDKPANEKIVRILELLANKNLMDFVDGDDDAQDFVKTLMDEKIKLTKLLWNGVQVIDNIFQDQGLNPGNNFHEWLKDVLHNYGIKNNEDLEKRMADLPESIRVRNTRLDLISNENFTIGGRLAIIAAEVNTETKVIFPDMSTLFYDIQQKRIRQIL